MFGLETVYVVPRRFEIFQSNVKISIYGFYISLLEKRFISFFFAFDARVPAMMMMLSNNIISTLSGIGSGL